LIERGPGQLIREVRLRHGLSQRRLAIRASLSPSTISRIERGRVSPSVRTLQELLFLMGEDLVLASKTHKPQIDREQLQERLAMTPTERIQAGLLAVPKD
jgi:transcriptional regulator with XRE-family HTH domain